jgi:TPR repeat protein
VVWYRKAAEQGDADAQTIVALMYVNGHGVSQDYAQALIWYRKAADQGNGSAQLGLGLMYANGHGVPQDYVRARMWFDIAAAAAGASDVSVRTAVKWRDLVATRMTPAQVAEAQRLAREWTPTK